MPLVSTSIPRATFYVVLCITACVCGECSAAPCGCECNLSSVDCKLVSLKYTTELPTPAS